MAERDLKEELKAAALRHGFHLAGIAPPGGWETAETLAPWLAAGFAGEMDYMRRDPEVRADPRRRYAWARSALVVGLRYRTPDAAPPAARRPFSSYAWGDDYHGLMGRMLAALKAEALALMGAGSQARWLVDTAPVLERAGAAAGGIGWIAKNTLLIHERAGSYIFLGEIFLSAEIEPDRAAPGRCGTCSRCLEACPTRAFAAPYLLDARRCISYLTIELSGPIPRDLRPLMGELVFGCDICQEVCPWNERAARREAPLRIEPLRPRPGLASVLLEDLTDLLALDGDEFRARFRKSAVKHAGRHRLARNACVALGNRGDPAALPALERALAADPDPHVRSHAAWAIGAIAARAPVAREAAQHALSRALCDPNADVREEARAAMEAIGLGDQRWC